MRKWDPSSSDRAGLPSSHKDTKLRRDKMPWLKMREGGRWNDSAEGREKNVEVGMRNGEGGIRNIIYLIK
jgi:hypothetical protein